MRSTRLLAACLTVLAVAACASTTPGWTYAPAPSPTAVPSVDASGSVAPSGSASAAPSASVAPSATAAPPSASASAGASGAPSGSAAPGASAGTVVRVSAQNIAFDPTELSVPADTAFQIVFTNNEVLPHNVEIKDAAGTSLFQGEVFSGPATRTYDAPPLAAGTYQFVCTVHPNMVGTLTAQ